MCFGLVKRVALSIWVAVIDRKWSQNMTNTTIRGNKLNFNCETNTEHRHWGGAVFLNYLILHLHCDYCACNQRHFHVMESPNISLIIPSEIDNTKVHLKYTIVKIVAILLLHFHINIMLPACNLLGIIFIRLQLDCTRCTVILYL